MVRTVSNAFETGRIPQAWILTGVRGVGKTTTARILARALNYELPDGSVNGPTIHMPVLGRALPGDHGKPAHRRAGDGRGLPHRRRRRRARSTTACAMRRRSARYKVYIIDEVHMLSTAAFNAFLKTLEEPPRARQVRVRHHRNPQSAGHGAVALPALRPAPRRCRRADGASGQHRGARKASRSSRRRSASSRARPKARCAIRCRCSTRRSRMPRAPVRAEDGAADARPCRPHPGDRSVRGADARRHRRRVQGIPRAIRHRRRSGVVLGDLAEFAHFVTRVKIVPAIADDVSLDARPSGCAAARFAAKALDAGAVADVADAAQGHRRGRRPPAGRSRPPKWCWCASPMPPTCRRRTRRSVRSATRAGLTAPRPRLSCIRRRLRHRRLRRRLLRRRARSRGPLASAAQAPSLAAA